MGIRPLGIESETEFNARLRSVMRSQGLGAIHIRDASVVGVPDLVVYEEEHLLAWTELKYDDEEVRPSQVEFLRAHRNSYVLRYSGKTENILVFRQANQLPMATVKIGIDWKTNLMAWNKYWTDKRSIQNG